MFVTDGGEMKHSNWLSHAADDYPDYNKQHQNCAFLAYVPNIGWDDHYCTFSLAVLCQRGNIFATRLLEHPAINICVIMLNAGYYMWKQQNNYYNNNRKKYSK